jgi:transaldolase
MTKLHELYETYGQSPWIDNIRRDWLNDGTLAQLVADGARGVTSNPAIFAKAFATSSAYDSLVSTVGSTDPETVFEALAVADVRDACDVLRPVYESSVAEQASGIRRFTDGYVSLEVSPRLAHDTAGTIEAAQRLYAAVDRPNVMIKIPATIEGLPAITAVLGLGINVNVTLIFSLERYRAVLDAWATGVALALANNHDVRHLASVASFFVSRVDAMVDELLPAGDDRRGRVANAQVAAAYEAYLTHAASEEVTDLLLAGSQVQRPLWASTSTKNPSYDELLYVNSIVANETVNTMPDPTLAATLTQGNFAASLLLDESVRREAVSLLASLEGDVSLDEVTLTLERDGVAAFIRSYDDLLALVQEKLDKGQQ